MSIEYCEFWKASFNPMQAMFGGPIAIKNPEHRAVTEWVMLTLHKTLMIAIFYIDTII